MAVEVPIERWGKWLVEDLGSCIAYVRELRPSSDRPESATP